jgi:hypothetical protein
MSIPVTDYLISKTSNQNPREAFLHLSRAMALSDASNISAGGFDAAGMQDSM